MNGIAWAIVTCEVLFWVFILSGLIVRYLARKEKMGLLLIAMTPVVDLALLVLTGIDLYRGATATAAHGVAAIYIGISIAYGKSMIGWADTKFRYYFLKSGEKPVKKTGMAFAKQQMVNWVRHLCAYVLGAGLLWGLTLWVGDASRTATFLQILQLWTLVLGIDLVITITDFIWPRKPKTAK